MKPAIRRSVISVVLYIIAISAAFAQTFDRVKERRETLDLIAHPPIQQLKLVDTDTATPQESAFVTFFKDEIWPSMSRVTELSFLSGMYNVAVDRALYDIEPNGDSPEKKDWQKRQVDADNEIQKIITSNEWKARVKNWAQLAEQGTLSGTLADFARRIWKEMELGIFSEAELPSLERMTKVMQDISDISNTSPLVPVLPKTEQAINATIDAYFKGQVSFEEAWKKIESLQPKGKAAHGQDVATKARDLLEEAAVLRTTLAKSKGFSSWAAYQVAQEARHYAEPFKTPEGRIQFLRDLLKATEGPYRDFLIKRLSEIPGASLDTLRRTQLSLLELESASLIRKYLPKEKIDEIWRAAMTASGFDPKLFETIRLDGYPRENKYTHAYMANVSNHAPKELTIHAKGLGVEAPAVDPLTWFPAHVYIVQNFRDNGPDAYETAFHEGGHGLDYSLREDLLQNEAAYGYVETHSMMMEQFLDDVEYLLSIGRDSDGNPIPRELAEKFVLNSRINTLMRQRTQFAYALYDLMLWSVPYTPDSEHFVDRARRLFGELVESAGLATGAIVEGVDWRMGGFATNHFYSGNVRYIGYIVAQMAADMSARKLHNVLKEKTGRETFLSQPLIAEILINGYYRKGFELPFPKSIEQFTGEPFSPDTTVKNMLKTIQNYRPCKKTLEGLGH